MIKFEIDKMIKNKLFVGLSILTVFALAGIFFVGYHYSQLSLTEKHNEEKGVSELYENKSILYAGNFDDQKVEDILSKYIEDYQKKEPEKRPFDLFSSNIADAFFPQGEDVYLKMNKAMENGKKLSMNQISLKKIKEIGFPFFKKGLTIGNYVRWDDFYKVTGSLFFVSCLLTILVCSSVFSGESSRNINQLLLSTKYGRTKLTRAKIIASTMVSVGLFLLIQVISFAMFFFYNKGFSGWDVSIQTNFSLNLFSFPAELNQLQVELLSLVVQLFGVLFIVGTTLFISSMTKTTFSSLAISLGIFALPLALLKLFKDGMLNKLLYLFPINNYNTETLLSIAGTSKGFLFPTFYANISFLLIFLLGLKLIFDLMIYLNIKNKSFN